MPKLLIVVPLYKAPELIEALFDSLIGVADEITALEARVVLINDSPGHKGLEAELDSRFPSLISALDAERLDNVENLGFVQSANRGFGLALSLQADVLLLNSDTLVTPGALTEIAAVATLDPLTSVVSPRSNNATICNSPYPDRFRGLPLDQAYEAHKALEPLLPRTTYVPTAVGFCLFVRLRMIQEFGVFDTVYGGGYNEENDFIMRCNRRGYRAVLANHAYVFHLGSISFGQSDTSTQDREAHNRKILLERYPEYERAVTRYFEGVEFRTQSLLSGLIPGPSGKLRLLFDANNLGPFHNGTFELAKKTIVAFVANHGEQYDIYIAGEAAALAFHGLDRVHRLTPCGGRQAEMAPFAFSVRLAQPFDLSHLTDAASLAPVTSFLILDTIAMDCLNLDLQSLEQVWSLAAMTTPVLGYISGFSRDQFRRRFRLASDVVEYVALCSTDPAEYRSKGEPVAVGAGPILLVGNHYSHKHVLDTLALLTARADCPEVIVLGLAVPEQAGVSSYQAGSLSQELVDSLYDQAGVVLFPSHYEGFGFPLTHALGRGKPVLARHLPVFDEIVAASPGGINVRLFDTTAAMVEAACRGSDWQGEKADIIPWSWTDSAKALNQALQHAVATLTYDSLHARQTMVAVLRAAMEVPQAAPTRVAEPAPSPASISKNLELPIVAVDAPAEYVAARVSARVRSMLVRLARYATLRTVGRVLWRLWPSGREANVNGNVGPVPGQKVGKLRVKRQALSDDWDQFARDTLDWADALVLGGTLHLTTPFDPHEIEPLSPLLPDAVRLWLTSAGFGLRSAVVEDGFVTVDAFKTRDWAAFLPGPTDDAAFVDAAFLNVLNRTADGFGQIHALDELKSGRSRRDVVRNLYASMERALLVRERVLRHTEQ